MLKDRYLVLIALLLVVLQTTLIQLIRIGGIVPNLSLIWVIISAVLLERMPSLRAALYSGLFTDILIGKGIGVNLCIFIIIAIVINSLEEKIFKDNYVTPVILIVIATLFYHVFVVFVHYFSTGQFLFFPRFFTIFIPEVIYNLVLGVFAYTRSFRLYIGYQMR